MASDSLRIGPYVADLAEKDGRLVWELRLAGPIIVRGDAATLDDARGQMVEALCALLTARNESRPDRAVRA